jgi:hypothetical protein
MVTSCLEVSAFKTKPYLLEYHLHFIVTWFCLRVSSLRPTLNPATMPQGWIAHNSKQYKAYNKINVAFIDVACIAGTFSNQIQTIQRMQSVFFHISPFSPFMKLVIGPFLKKLKRAVKMDDERVSCTRSRRQTGGDHPFSLSSYYVNLQGKVEFCFLLFSFC